MKKNFFKEAWWRTLLPPLFLIILGLYLSYTNILVRVDRFIYDYISTWSTRAPAEDIVIIAIDSDSLLHYGQWPWPREIHADLIDKITIGGAKAIGFDIIMSEPDRSDKKNDILLAQAIKRSDKVVLPVFAEHNANGNGLHLTKPISILAEAASGIGHVDFELDADGIVRRTYLKGGIGHPDWSAFALVIQQTSTNNVNANEPPSATYVNTGNWVRTEEVLLSFAGKPGHFKQISCLETHFQPLFLESHFSCLVLKSTLTCWTH